MEFESNVFGVLYDGEKLFDVEGATLGGAGKVGRSAKADSVTCFDDFAIESK